MIEGRARAVRRRARCALAAALLAAGGIACAQPAADRFARCASCHGEGGVSPNFETPSLAGQHSFYAITQLFLFRAGRRASEAMTKEAKDMSDADLRVYSEIIGKLPAAAPIAPAPADATRVARGVELAARNRCASCHGDDYAGDKQVPRLAGQREDYLGKTLGEFKAGSRLGYTQAMNEALAGVAVADLPDLAHYLAHFGGPASAPTH